MHDNAVEGMCIRNRCQWCKEGGKFSTFFLNLGNFNGTQSQICQIILNDEEITDTNKVLNEINFFYESVFKNGDSKTPSQINDFLDKVQLTKLNISEVNECDIELSGKKCISP